MAQPAHKVRAARQFLRKKAKAATKDISPAQFAAAAAEQSASFNQVLNTIKFYYASGDERERMRHDQLNSAPA